jgi:hypothetical protein
MVGGVTVFGAQVGSGVEQYAEILPVEKIKSPITK